MSASERRRRGEGAPIGTQRRAETGVVTFGDDWPGVFIRGDNAHVYASTLAAMTNGNPMLDGLVRLLRRSGVASKGHRVDFAMRPFDECVSVGAADAERVARERDAALARVAALEDAVAGRPGPPTDAEIVAHCASGGFWRTDYNDRIGVDLARGLAIGQREGDVQWHVIGGRMPTRWWALNAKYEVTTWPEAVADVE